MPYLVRRASAKAMSWNVLPTVAWRMLPCDGVTDKKPGIAWPTSQLDIWGRTETHTKRLIFALVYSTRSAKNAVRMKSGHFPYKIEFIWVKMYYNIVFASLTLYWELQLHFAEWSWGPILIYNLPGLRRPIGVGKSDVFGRIVAHDHLKHMHSGSHLTCPCQCTCRLGSAEHGKASIKYSSFCWRKDKRNKRGRARMLTSFSVMLVETVASDVKRHLTLSLSGSCARRRILEKQFWGTLHET